MAPAACTPWPLDLGDGAQADQVLQQVEELGQVGAHEVHVAEVRVLMQAGRVGILFSDYGTP